jgi:Ca-activated chloride channel family protein
MTDGRGRACGALVLSILTILLGAAAAVSGRQVFRGRTDLVVLNVTVSDAAGRLVPGLEQTEFQVFEDGVLQTVTNFTREPQPIALAILLDSSVSMESKLKTAQEAAIGFAKRLTSRDVAEIIDFDTYAQVLQTFTADADKLEAAIRRTEAGGSTALYNALYIAFNEFKKERARAPEEVRRHAVVVLSDGEDTSSVVSFDLVLDEAKRSEVMTYGIGIRPKETGPGPTRAWNQAAFVLRTISFETGGKSFTVEDSQSLPAIYDQIARELANQYTLGYVSTNQKRDGAWRKITVQMAPPDNRARTKTGYFAPTTPR